MSLQRTPSSGAIVKELLRFGSLGFDPSVGIAPFPPSVPLPPGQTYTMPPNITPGASTAQILEANGLSFALFGVRMQFDGAIVRITVKNRTPTGLASDIIKYNVGKLPADTVFSASVLTILAPAPGPNGPSDSLEVDVPNTDLTVKTSAIAVNNSSRGAFLAGDYIVIVMSNAAPLSAAPGAIDCELEYFSTH